ncbi:MAG: alpha-L-fucosidase, partial [Candidatus Lokiarchaeota archaeon]|nr:alpha-L-fucosidase [Candidatus Lokiarchaeota archaeon]
MFKPTIKSLKNHNVPKWFHDAKLGIFIHWGLYSIPAYAPTEFGGINETIGEHGWEFHYRNNPYAEWYQNSIRIEGTKSRKYHIENYGKEFSYSNFAPKFNELVEDWDPHAWATLFKNAGAKYVVLTTKHHDGFLLWPSDHPNPRKNEYYAKRNLVGELTNAVRDQELRMGVYYSGILDWTFNNNPITDLGSFMNNGSIEPEYAEYVYQHYMELIEKYKPSILWNDIGYPSDARLPELIAHYYNSIEHGLINDRWDVLSKKIRKLLSFSPIEKVASWVSKMAIGKGMTSIPSKGIGDYTTPEY